jgi:hypothetical protein
MIPVSSAHGYVLEDASGVFTPNDWAREAIALYRARRANRIVAEVNNGGDMVATTLRVVDANIPFTPVHASRGKVIRAEPISALYEQGRVHHVGAFPILEDQMCAFTSDFDRVRAGYSPDRMDALVWALTELAVSDSSAEEWIAWAADLAARSRGMPPRVECPIGTGSRLSPTATSWLFTVRVFSIGPAHLAQMYCGIINFFSTPCFGQRQRLACLVRSIAGKPALQSASSATWCRPRVRQVPLADKLGKKAR